MRLGNSCPKISPKLSLIFILWRLSSIDKLKISLDHPISKKLPQIKKNYLVHILLTSQLTQSLTDKHISITTKATGLIFALFNVTSSRVMPSCQPQQLQCLHHSSNSTCCITVWFLGYHSKLQSYTKQIVHLRTYSLKNNSWKCCNYKFDTFFSLNLE